MSDKRARKAAKRQARKQAGAKALRALRERDQLESRRASAHGLAPWSGPERQRKAGRLVARTREALRASGTVTRGDVQREREGRLVVVPDPKVVRAIDDALEGAKEEEGDGREDDGAEAR